MKLFLLDKKTGQIVQTILDTSPEYENTMNDISVAENYHRIYVLDTVSPQDIKVSFDPVTNTYYPAPATIVTPTINSAVL